MLEEHFLKLPACVQIPSLPLTCCVALNKLFNFSVPQYPHHRRVVRSFRWVNFRNGLRKVPGTKWMLHKFLLYKIKLSGLPASPAYCLSYSRYAINTWLNKSTNWRETEDMWVHSCFLLNSYAILHTQFKLFWSCLLICKIEIRIFT